MANSKELYDTRLVHHKIRRTNVTESDYQAHLDALPDDAEHAEDTETKFSSSYQDRHYGPEAIANKGSDAS